MYKLAKNSITRLSDNASIPLSETNADYVEYLNWLAVGNTPSPIDPPTQAELDAIATQVQDSINVNAVKVNAVINYLVTHTPAECAAKVQIDITNLATAKDMLAHFAQALCVLCTDKLR